MVPIPRIVCCKLEQLVAFIAVTPVRTAGFEGIALGLLLGNRLSLRLAEARNQAVDRGVEAWGIPFIVCGLLQGFVTARKAVQDAAHAVLRLGLLADAFIREGIIIVVL